MALVPRGGVCAVEPAATRSNRENAALLLPQAEPNLNTVDYGVSPGYSGFLSQLG